MDVITEWGVVGVIVVLVGLIASLFKFYKEFSTPLEELKQEVIKLNLSLASVTKAIERLQNDFDSTKETTREEIAVIKKTINRHNYLLQHIATELDLKNEDFELIE